MPIKLDSREYRDMIVYVSDAPDVDNVDTSENDEIEERKIVEGYATTFDDPYTLFETDEFIFIESVSKNAFDNTDMSDVIMQYDHAGRVFARMSNGTLEATPDDFGLHIVADLGGTEIGRNLFEEIRGGYTNKMSFGFTISDDSWDDSERAEDGRVIVKREILGIGKLFDVSAVSLPANDGTSISASSQSVRNLCEGVIEKIQAERMKHESTETERKRAMAKAKAIRGF